MIVRSRAGDAPSGLFGLHSKTALIFCPAAEHAASFLSNASSDSGLASLSSGKSTPTTCTSLRYAKSGWKPL